MGEEVIKGDPKKKKSKSALRKVLIATLFTLIFFFTFISSILYIPKVQNLVVDIISNQLSKRINGDIEIGKVRLKFAKGLVLEDFLILNNETKDTLIKLEYLNSSFKDNLGSLLKRRLSLKTIELTGFSAIDVKGSKSLQSNLTMAFQSSDKRTETGSKDTTKVSIDKPKKPFLIDLQNLILNDINYSYIDSIKGQTLNVLLDNAVVKVKNIDLECGEYSMNTMDTRGLGLNLEYFSPSEYKFPVAENENENFDQLEEATDTTNFYVDNIKIRSGSFTLRDKTKESTVGKGDFDTRDIKFSEIDMILESFHVNSLAEVEARIKDGMMQTVDNKFVVNDFDCGQFSLTKRRMTFDSLYIKSENSEIQDKLVFKFRDIKDFNDFNNKIILEGQFKKSRIGINELNYFASALKRSNFFVENSSRKININGLISGRVNSLNANNINIRVGEELVIRGRMNSRNLDDVDNALMNLDLEEFAVSIRTLNSLIPGFEPPANFYKLGKIRFNGRFDGYFQDFVTYGDLASDLGTANLDMRLDVKNGIQGAKYSGTVALNDFDLSTWSNNSNFGILAADARVVDGNGLSLESVNSILSANVNTLEFKGYTYQDFRMDGKFEKNLFDGDFTIQDPNIDLNFAGTIDFTDTIPKYDFVADVNRIRLKTLNLTEQDFEVQGNLNINATGTDLDNAQGQASGSSFVLTRAGNDFYLDSFNINAIGAFPDRRRFILNSSLVDAELDGLFKMEELPDAFISSLKTNYPAYAKQLNFIKYENPTPGYDFTMNMSIKESEDIIEVLTGESIFIRNAEVLGRISDDTKRSALNVDFPYLEINGDLIEGLKADLFAKSDEGELNLSFDGGHYANIVLSSIEFSAKVERENLSFSFYTPEILDSFSQIQIDGTLLTAGELFKINLKNTGFEAFGSKWNFNDNNNILFGEKKIIIDNLFLTDGKRTLVFNDINEVGIATEIKNLTAGFFNRLLSQKSVELRGDLSGLVEIENIFAFQGINADLNIPNFGFNKHEFGSINFQASSKSFDDPIGYNLTAIDNSKNINIDGAYYLKDKRNLGEIRVTKYPLDLLEYILSDGISQTRGTTTGTLSYSGPLAEPEMKGQLIISDGGTKIDYLGVEYGVGKNVIYFSPGFIDFSNCELIDKNNQKAIIQGGLRHQSFRSFETDLRIRSPRFIALNTTKKENPSYYGFAQGEIDVSFNGPFESIKIEVNATTGRNSVLNIPVEYVTEEISSSFIEIIDKSNKSSIVDFKPIRLTGLNLEMNVNVTEDAEVLILFDETANDILDSRGRGAIQLSINPEGDFEMYGDYEVVDGEYLFTIPGLPVNKSFIIKNGGNIQWTGDPLDANLDINAEYKGLQASLKPFLEEYLPEGNASLVNQAELKTDVSLLMNLGGTMSSPDINFDIDFPNLTGELKPVAEGKLSTLKANQDAYNEQVFGLILLRSFIPTNTLLTNNLVGTTYSTISEFVSNQFSILLSSFFEEALQGNSYFTGLDVSFAASKSDFSGTSGFLPDEYDINFISSFDENKWNVQIGGRYVVNNTFNTVGEYFAPDFVFEYYISEDRRLKLNIYARSDYDANDARKLQSGLGLSYRREFNSLGEFAKGINDKAKGDL